MDVPDNIYRKKIKHEKLDLNLRYVTNISNILSRRMVDADFLNFLSIENWDVSNVTDMHKAFNSCRWFNCDLSRWNTGRVIDMHGMFNECSEFHSDLSKWNTENVTNMDQMFSYCRKFHSDLSRWNIKNVKSMNNMFTGCQKFIGTRILANWKIPKGTNVEKMFEGTKTEMDECALGIANSCNISGGRRI
jgi:surface protein